jgi:hypothetical protein
MAKLKEFRQLIKTVGKRYLFSVEDESSMVDSVTLTSMIRNVTFSTPNKTIITFMIDQDGQMWEFFKNLSKKVIRFSALTENGTPVITHRIKVHSSTVFPESFDHGADDALLLGKCILLNTIIEEKCEENF